ncbi:MAG: methyltransferase [Desulfobulbaceae bacterium]|nr:methyltransferase [Desulfobulbaceae bacterium]
MRVCPADQDYTDESLFGGSLICRQARKGYRFSVDAVLLAHFVSVEPCSQVLELGAGCGIVSLVLAYRQPSLIINSLEIQPQLYALACHNIAINGYHDRVNVLQGDVRQVADHVSANTFDLVLTNPPYQQLNSSRLGPCPERAVARHQLKGGLASFTDAAFFALKDGGRLGVVYPAAQEDELVQVLGASGFAPRRIQRVSGYPGSMEKLVLVEAVKNGPPGLTKEPSMTILTQLGGDYTEEVAGFYEPNE